MFVEKEILRPGTYWYLDRKTKKPKSFTATPQVIKHFHDAGQEMLSLGLAIPVPLEHQIDAEGKGVHPQTPNEKAAQRLLHNAGEVKQYRMKGDQLWAKLDIQDPEAAKKISRTIKYTSPYIDTFTDGNGKNWNGVITHVALTSRPRITKQEPFQSIAAAMSLEAADFEPEKLPALAGFPLSKAGLLKQGATGLSPRYPVAFSGWSGIAMAAYAEEDLESAKKKAKRDDHHDAPRKPPMKERRGDPREEHHNPDEHEDMEEIHEIGEQLVDADGDIDVCDVICDLLEAIGIYMPEGTHADNFHENLYKAAMDHVKNKTNEGAAGMGDHANQPSVGQKNQLPANPVIQEQPPMFMALSLDEVEKVEDPRMKQIARAAFSLQQNALNEARQKRNDRIAAICKRLRHDQQIRPKLEAQAAAFSLSLTKEGPVHDPMSPLLEILESAYQDIPAMLLTSPGERQEQPHPKDMHEGQMSTERLAQVVAELERNGGLAPPPVATVS